MTVVNVELLSGPALDWAVARSFGWVDFPSDSIEQGNYWHLDAEKAPYGRRLYKDDWKPSSDWGQAGRIIQDKGITLVARTDFATGTPDYWATMDRYDGQNADERTGVDGPTPIVAAMRCFVASELGYKIEIPDGFDVNPEAVVNSPSDSSLRP
jgi:hypothetical protein